MTTQKYTIESELTNALLTRKEIDKYNTADLVIVDESSMLDLNICDQLLVQLNTQHTKIIL